MASRRQWHEFDLGVKYSGNVHEVNTPPGGCVEFLDLDVVTKPGSYLPRKAHENIIWGDEGRPVMPLNMTSYSHIGELILQDGSRRVVMLGDAANENRYGVVWAYNPDLGDWDELTTGTGTNPTDVSVMTAGEYGDRSLLLLNGEIRAYGERTFWWGKSKALEVGGNNVQRFDPFGETMPDYIGTRNSLTNAEWQSGMVSMTISGTPEPGVTNDSQYLDGNCVQYAYSFVFADGQESPLVIPSLESGWIHTVNNPNPTTVIHFVLHLDGTYLTMNKRVKGIRIYNRVGTSYATTFLPNEYFLIVEFPVYRTKAGEVYYTWYADGTGIKTVQIDDFGGNADGGRGRVRSYLSMTGINAPILTAVQSGLDWPTVGYDLMPDRRYVGVSQGRLIFGGVEQDGIETVDRFYWTHTNRDGARYDLVPALNFQFTGLAGKFLGSVHHSGYDFIICESGFIVAQFGSGGLVRADVSNFAIGCLARESIADTPFGIAFLASNGFHLVTGINDYEVIADEIFSDIRLYPDAAKAAVKAKYSPRHECYWVYMPEYIDDLSTPNVTYPAKFYAYHIPSRSCWRRTVSGNGQIYAMANDCFNGVIVGSKSESIQEISRVESLENHMDLANSTPTPKIQSGYRKIGGAGEQHDLANFAIYNKTYVPTDLVFRSRVLDYASSVIEIEKNEDWEMTVIACPRDRLSPSLWHSIELYPADSLRDPNSALFMNPLSMIPPIPIPSPWFWPPQGAERLGWELTRPLIQALYDNRELK